MVEKDIVSDLFNRIFEVLGLLPAMSKPRDRELMISRLPSHLAGMIDSQGETRHIANKFAELFRDRDNEQGDIDALLKAINAVEENNRNYKKLERLVRTLEALQKLSEGQRNNICKLANLVKGFSLKDGKEWYKKTLPTPSLDSSKLFNEDDYGWEHMLAKLFLEHSYTFSVNDADPRSFSPLIKFVWGLTQKEGENFICKINLILEELLGLEKGKITALREKYINSLKVEGWPKFYLLVDIQENQANKYCISFYTAKRSIDETYKFEKVDETTSFEYESVDKSAIEQEIEKRLNHLLDKCPQPDLIEIFMPLSLDLHEFQFDECIRREEDPDFGEFKESTFGETLPIVIRPRLKKVNEEIKQRKINRWKCFQNSSEVICSSFSEKDDHQTFYYHLDHSDNADVYFVELAFPVDDIATIKAVIRAGIPIALWFRRFSSCSSKIESIKKQISKHDKQALPQIIHRMRLDDRGNSNKTRLSLLFDDPERDILLFSQEENRAKYPSTY